jgi:hypothetical protein
VEVGRVPVRLLKIVEMYVKGEKGVVSVYKKRLGVYLLRYGRGWVEWSRDTHPWTGYGFIERYTTLLQYLYVLDRNSSLGLPASRYS